MSSDAEKEYEWFDPGHLKFILKALKKYHMVNLDVYTFDGELYRLNFNKDDKSWVINHMMKHGECFTETKRNLNNYLNRISNIKEIRLHKEASQTQILDIRL